MVRTKQHVSKKKALPVKKAVTKKPKEKTKRHRKTSFGPYVNRLCKKSGILPVSPDSMPVVSGGIDQNIKGFVDYLQTMLGNKKRMVSIKAVKLAFIGYREKQGVNPKLILQQTAAGLNAVEALCHPENDE